MENKIKQKAKKIVKKYKKFKVAQLNFYSAYEAKFGNTRELKLLIGKGIQASDRQREFFYDLMDLMSNTDFEKEGGEVC